MFDLEYPSQYNVHLCNVIIKHISKTFLWDPMESKLNFSVR